MVGIMQMQFLIYITLLKYCCSQWWLQLVHSNRKVKEQNQHILKSLSLETDIMDIHNKNSMKSFYKQLLELSILLSRREKEIHYPNDLEIGHLTSIQFPGNFL